jgi:precorrin-6B methylase 2
MVFPNCEKLGQTIIFVRMKETSRQLHKQLMDTGFKITRIQVGRWRSLAHVQVWQRHASTRQLGPMYCCGQPG